MEALVVAAGLPTGSGVTDLRLKELLRRIHDAGFQTHLLARRRAADDDRQMDDMRGLCRWVHLHDVDRHAKQRAFAAWMRGSSYIKARRHSHHLNQHIRDLTPRVSLVAVVDAIDHAAVWESIVQVPDAHRPFLMIDLQETLSRRLRTASSTHLTLKRWGLRSEAAIVEKLEKDAVAAANLTLVADAIELDRLSSSDEGPTVWLAGNGVTRAETVGPGDLNRVGAKLLFLGDVAVRRNERAALWLAEQVLPQLQQSHPNAELIVAARQTPRALRRITSRKGVTIVERPDGDIPGVGDMRTALIGIAPQRNARGLNQAVLQMLAVGRPVIATQRVAINLPGETGAAVAIADQAAEFASKAGEMIADRNLAFRHAQQSQTLAAKAASWQSQFSRLSQLLAKLATQQAVAPKSDAARRHSHNQLV